MHTDTKPKGSFVKRNHGHRKLILLGIIGLLLVALVGSGYVRLGDTSTTARLPSGVATKATPADNKSNDARKKSTSPAPTLNAAPTSAAPNTQNTPMVLTVTRASVVDNSLQVGTLVSGTTTGTCTLKVSQPGQQTVTRTAHVINQNSSYACPVFSVPTDQFPNLGKWNVSVTLQKDSASNTVDWVSNPVNLSGQKT